jgi:hypothetical protein
LGHFFKAQHQGFVALQKMQFQPMFMRVVAHVADSEGVWGMLSEKEVLERAFRALDELVGQHPETTPSGPGPEGAALSLKGQAVELRYDRACGRVFIVADEEDAQETMRRFGARRGEVWTPGEIELVARFEDPAIRDEVAGFKRRMGGCFSPDAARWGPK